MEIYPQLMLIHNRSETNNQDRYTPPKIQLYEFSIFRHRCQTYSRYKQKFI